jgi:hypothetical protein
MWNCRGCGVGGDVIALVKHLDGRDFETAVRMLAGERPALALTAMPTSRMAAASNRTEVEDYEQTQHRKAAGLWARHRPIRGTIAEKYLRGRGITCPLPVTLGYLPPGKPDYHPALIAAFALPHEVEPRILGKPHNVGAVHLTLLTPDGMGKAEVKPNKLIIGSPGALPITLAPPNDLLAMAISEGVEDALALHEALGVGAWAAGAAGFMPKLVRRVPDWTEVVIVEVHPDDGRRYAKQLADTLRHGGVEVIEREAVA